MSLEAVFERFRLGDLQLFDAVFRELWPALCYYGCKITGNRMVSEDISAESFIKVWERRTDFKRYAELKSFLYTTVRNASIDWLRKQATSQKGLKNLAPVTTEMPSEIFSELAITETYRRLHAAIGELPEQCRKVITLSYLEGKSGKEVAAELGLDHTTVRTHKHRGIALLRQRLRIFLPFL